MRYVVKHAEPLDKLALSDAECLTLGERFALEVDEGLKARYPQEELWTDLLRQYAGVPEVPVRNLPIENAPNYEVTLGAIECEQIVAQAIDTIFNQTSPLLTCRPAKDDKQLAQAVMRLQRWVNHIADHEVGIRQEGEHTALDWGQLGTGVMYCPWINEVMQTKYYEVRNVGARTFSHPLEDLILPAGSYDDLQQMPWVGLRFWYNQTELELRAQQLEWDISQCVQAGIPGYVRSYRERLSRNWTSMPNSTPYSILYQIIDIYAFADVFGDGVTRDVLLTLDYTARKLVDYRYSPYQRRPIRYARYQKRAHLPLGMGVLEMVQDFQRQLSDCHNDAQLNSRLANMKLFKGKPNAVPGGVVKAYPWKVIETMEPAEFGELKVSDVYPSAYRDAAAIINYAEQRVGVRNLSGPSPANVMGGRTPGITALSVMQKTSQRFAPAFDDLRFCYAGALIECCWRYREQLQLGGEAAEMAEKNITTVMGQEDAKFVIDLLKSEDFEHMVTVEMTASSSQTNRLQDRQESIQLGSYIMGYAEKAVQFLMIAANPHTPPVVKEVAQKIADVVNAVIERTVRTFDSIHDPSSFVLDLQDEIGKIQATPDAMGQLMSIVQQLGQGKTDAAANPQTGQMLQ